MIRMTGTDCVVSVQLNRYSHTHNVISIIDPLIPLGRINASGME